jgi:hypothetical protein
VITLQQGVNGYSGAEDTYIYVENPGGIYYSSSPLGVDTSSPGSGLKKAALVRFGLSSIPTGATILSASLQLYAVGWGGGNMAIGAYAITRTVTLSQVTWNNAQTGNPWGVAGCNNTTTDRRANAESSLTTSGTNKWYAFDLTALVQAWVNGTVPNNGVLMRAWYSAGIFVFASNEHSDYKLRPRLVIAYVR